MIVNAKVLKSFKHVETGLVWFEGDTFKGSAEAASVLASRGYLDYGGHPAASAHSPELATLTVKELVAICVKEGIETPSKPKKADLIAAIQAARG